jgi:hypothetical protein
MYLLRLEHAEGPDNVLIEDWESVVQAIDIARRTNVGYYLTWRGVPVHLPAHLACPPPLSVLIAQGTAPDPSMT